jgi:hypothetical protein
MCFGTLPFAQTGNKECLSVQAGFLILMEEMGSGSETFIRVPQAGQYVLPVCSSTLGTVVNAREQLGHFTLMILTKHCSWLVGFVKFTLSLELNNVWIFRKPANSGVLVFGNWKCEVAASG